MILETKHNFGDILYLKTDPEQKRRVLIGINFRVTGVLFELAKGETTSWHYEFEMSHESDVLAKTE